MRNVVCILLLGVSLLGVPAGADQVVPVVAAIQGDFGSAWRSDLKITNPYDHSVGFDLIFTPRGESQSGLNPKRTYTLAPNQTLFLEDVYHLGYPGQDGAARLLIRMHQRDASGEVYGDPIVDVSVYNRTGPGQEYGQSPSVYTVQQIAGATQIRRIPVGKAGERTNVGVVTGAAGAMITWVGYNAAGLELVRRPNVAYPQNAFVQHYGSPDGVAELLGQPLPENGSLESIIVSGSAITSVTFNNNTTNDSRWRDLGTYQPVSQARLVGIDINHNGTADNIDEDGDGALDDVMVAGCGGPTIWFGTLVVEPSGTYTFEHKGTLPAGMQLNTNTGVIQYQPPCDLAGQTRGASFRVTGSTAWVAANWYIVE